MSPRCARLQAFFLAPAAGCPAPPPPIRGLRPGDGGRPLLRAAEDGFADPGAGGGPAVGVVGDAAGALAVDLAAALGQRARRGCAVAVLWGGPPPAPVRGAVRGAARATAAGLERVPGVTVSCGGRVVGVSLPRDGAAGAGVYEAVRSAAGDGVPLVLALCGPRPQAFDRALARMSLLVVALAGGAPAELPALAAASLAGVAPAAVVLLAAPSPPGLPRPLRHRAAVRRILERL